MRRLGWLEHVRWVKGRVDGLVSASQGIAEECQSRWEIGFGFEAALPPHFLERGKPIVFVIGASQDRLRFGSTQIFQT
jgi:hypothetical protein